MKDFSVKNIPKDTVYKDVVIIGNGPSGISLSYMLAGNWPYWNPEKIEKHPDELLRARLNYADSSKSLVLQDLMSFADGLEGRSTNPVSLLLDSLEHPCADLGMELPSMLEYKSHPNAQIDHIVLGKGPPGGSWHRMDPNLRTLSLAAWMSLPGLSFSDWETRQLKNELIGKVSKTKTTQTKRDNITENLQKQAVLNSTCQKCIELRTKSPSNGYSRDFTIENNNESESGALCCKCTKALKNQTNDVDVNTISSENKTKIANLKTILAKDGQTTTTIIANTSENVVAPENERSPVKVPPRRNLSLKRQISKEVQTRALVSRVAEYYEDYVYQMNLDKYFMNDTIVTMIVPIHENCAVGKFKSARWLVCGIVKSIGKVFYFACKSLVLANGASDLANRLGLRGEDANISWVKHELPQLEAALESLTDEERKKLKPVLIVGAGLSAADAVTICRSSDVNVVHVFRSRTAGLDKMLPENVYPEYHEVHKMMKDANNFYDYYSPLPEHTLVEVTTSNGVHKVTVENLNTNEKKTIEVSFCAILIGSRPDLRFAASVVKCCNKSNVETIYSIGERENSSIFSRKISWLKNLCVKCKHLNLCDWGRRSDYRKVCNHINAKNCDCSKIPICKELSMVSLEEQSGIGLGIDPSKPIDCKSNQIAVDKYTNEVLRAPKGLYAMGPLVGDNFVRFISGGALAITSALHKEND